MVPQDLKLDVIPEYCSKLEKAMQDTAKFAAWD
jgi:hypothetical protein